MAKISGVAHWSINGVNYCAGVEEGVTITCKGTEREYIKDSCGRNHYTEKPVLDEIDGSFLLVDGLNPTTITQIADTTVSIEFGNAKKFILTNAGYTGDGSVSTKDGMFKVKFTGTGKWL